MRTKQEIVENWLPRYTERKLEDFTKHILLLTLLNMSRYLRIILMSRFGIEKFDAQCLGRRDYHYQFWDGKCERCYNHGFISAVMPKAVLFLGKCGGLKRANVLGDYVLPIAAIRGEGTSNEYLPPEVPSLPAFSMLRAISSAIRDHGKDYWTGTIYTTNRRVWEYDNAFKEYLRSTHATGIDMETATLLTAGFANQIPTGALLMISDKPMEEDGVKTEASDRKVTQQFVGEQVMLGVEALQQILDGKKTIRHIRFSW